MTIAEEQAIISDFIDGESFMNLANRYDCLLRDIEDILREAMKAP